MQFFFVSKFDWLGAGPMSTVSTMFTHAISCQNLKTTFITQSDQCDIDETLKKRFGIVPNSNYSVRIFKKIKIIRTSTLFYLRAFHYLLFRARSGDIIYTRNSTFLPYLFFLKKLTRAKVYFEAHGYHGNSHEDNIKNRINRYNLTEDIFLRRIDGVCSLTNAMSRLFKKDYPDLLIQTLPLGSSSISAKFKIDPSSGFSARCLCYIGRCNENIDTETVFRAVSLCRPSNVKLLWIGITAEQKESLLKLAESLHIISQVELIPWLGYYEMCETVHKKASAGLAAYTDSYESNFQISPTKIFDFFSFALPVIGSKVGAIEEIISNDFSSLLYEPDNATDLAAKINNLFSSFDNYCQYCRKSSELAEIYSWENRAKKFLSFASSPRHS